MRKIFLLLAVAALVVLPSLALAQTEFSLGGYIKLDTWWDSSAMGKNLSATPVTRSNNPTGQHGRFNATAQSTRFNFTIKGPKLFGAAVTGFIEMDFDAAGDGRQNSGNSYAPRLRHAMFRMNWPGGTELLLGQYWGFVSDFSPDMVQDGPLQNHGFAATDRFAQARLTQTFGLGWAKDDKLTLGILVGKPIDAADANVNPTYLGNAGGLPGQTSETPQIQGKIEYEGDLWGKAAFFGRPRGFVAQVAGGWQRTHYANATNGLPPAGTFTAWGIGHPSGQGLDPDVISQRNAQYLNNWVLTGTLFIPVIPTHTPNLAGTLAFSAHAYVGEGLEFIGNATGQNSFFRSPGNSGLLDTNVADRQLQKVWGGYLQANYYFNNEWYTNLVFGTGQNYGIDRDKDYFLTDPVKGWYETAITLYYRPVQAVRFGLQYDYSRTTYYQTRPRGPQTLPAAPGFETGPNRTDNGSNHRVEFGAWFYF